MSLISSFKGLVGEIQGTLAAKIRLNSEIYRSINNVTIPTANGTTQIDHVIVSKYGIFVEGSSLLLALASRQNKRVRSTLGSF